MEPKQLHIMELLDSFSSSALAIQDQKEYVAEILESIEELEDEVRYNELMGEPSDDIFVVLARRRLIKAQETSFENFNALRELKGHLKKEEISKEKKTPTSLFESVKPKDLQQSIYEAKTESMTKILYRMHNMAQEEVMKGELNIMELDTSSKALTDLQQKYSAVDVLLNGSRKLVKILDEADKWDRRCMLASLGFLLFSFLYVLYRRVLHGPVKLLLWFILRLLGVAGVAKNAIGAVYDSPHSIQMEAPQAFQESFETHIPYEPETTYEQVEPVESEKIELYEPEIIQPDFNEVEVDVEVESIEPEEVSFNELETQEPEYEEPEAPIVESNEPEIDEFESRHDEL